MIPLMICSECIEQIKNFTPIQKDIYEAEQSSGFKYRGLFKCNEPKCTNHIENMDWVYNELGIKQPERSKREDSQCEMRCSEHCGNTMRDK